MIYGAIDDVMYFTLSPLSKSQVNSGCASYRSASTKQDIINKVVGGVQNLASFARVENAGHLVSNFCCICVVLVTYLFDSIHLPDFVDQIVQMNPQGLAEKLYDVLIVAALSDGLSPAKSQLEYSAQAKL